MGDSNVSHLGYIRKMRAGFAPEHRAQLGVENPENDRAPVLEVAGEG
jgi:hypothetical protein